MLVLLLACWCGDRDGWVTFDEADATGVETRFSGYPAWTPTPQEAFTARDACPALSRARAKPEREGVWAVDVEGEHLDRVQRAVGILDGGKLADIRFERNADGSLTLPIACASCDVYLGIVVDGHPIACKGSGWSLHFEDGQPSAPPAPPE